MTPYSAAAAGSRSSRASSRRAALSTSSGSSSASSRSRSSLISACSASPSPSSSWIAFSCWRRKNSRWPFSISDWTCDWIFVPSSRTSSSRFRITETSRRRSSTFTSSSSCCFSSVLRRSVDATRWQSALGSSTFAAASWSSSGRYGHERDHAREEALHVARQRLDLPRLLELVGQLRELGHEVRLVARRARRDGRAGSPARGSAACRRGRGSACARSRRCRRRRGRRSRAARPSSFFTVTSASRRSPATTSSISLIERSWPIASGVIDSGKTTVSLSGSTGMTGGELRRLR